jgi:hypothetical protein
MMLMRAQWCDWQMRYATSFEYFRVPRYNFTKRTGIAKICKSYASLTQVALRRYVGGNGGRNLRQRGRSAWKAVNLNSGINTAFTQVSSVWTGSSAGEILIFIEGLQKASDFYISLLNGLDQPNQGREFQ